MAVLVKSAPAVAAEVTQNVIGMTGTGTESGAAEMARETTKTVTGMPIEVIGTWGAGAGIGSMTDANMTGGTGIGMEAGRGSDRLGGREGTMRCRHLVDMR